MTRVEQLADAAAGISIASFVGISLTEWDVLIHIFSGVVGIIAGIFAIFFHVIRLRNLKRIKNSLQGNEES